MTHSSVGLILGLLLWKVPRTAACYLLTDQRWPRTIQSEEDEGEGEDGGMVGGQTVSWVLTVPAKRSCVATPGGDSGDVLCQPHERLQQCGRQARKEKQKRKQLLVLSPYFWILE